MRTAANEAPHPFPGDAGGLAPTPKRPVPKSSNLGSRTWTMPGCSWAPRSTADAPRQPSAATCPHQGSKRACGAAARSCDLAELRLQPLPDCLSHHREPSIPLLPANVDTAIDTERLTVVLLRCPHAAPALGLPHIVLHSSGRGRPGHPRNPHQDLRGRLRMHDGATPPTGRWKYGG